MRQPNHVRLLYVYSFTHTVVRMVLSQFGRPDSDYCYDELSKEVLLELYDKNSGQNGLDAAETRQIRHSLGAEQSQTRTSM